MSLRTITGTLFTSANTPRVGTDVIFRRRGTGIMEGTVYLPDEVKVTTNSQGQFSVDLIVTTESETPISWNLIISGRLSAWFSLSPGDPIDISEIAFFRLSDITPVQYSTIVRMIEDTRLKWRGEWTSGIQYYENDLFIDPVYRSTYLVLAFHQAGDLATDLAADRVVVMLDSAAIQSALSGGVTYPNIAAMLADNRQFMTNDVVKVLGYYEAGDGGGGDFYFDAASTETANGKTVFAAAGGGRWFRVLEVSGGVTYPNIAAMLADNRQFLTNDVAKVLGYYASGDFGPPINLIIQETSNGVKSWQLADGRFANLYAEGAVKLRWLGARGDGNLSDGSGTDDRDVIFQALQDELELDGENLVYKLSSAFSVTGKKVVAKNMTLMVATGSTGGISLNESPIASGLVNTASLLREGVSTVTFDDTSGLASGDLIRLRCADQLSGSIVQGQRYVITEPGGDFASVGASDNLVGTDFIATGPTPTWGTGALLPLWPFDPRPGVTNVTLGEVKKISSIAGNVVTFGENLFQQYEIGFILTWTAYRPKEVTLDRVNIIRHTPEIAGGLSIAFKDNPIFNNGIVKNCASAGLSIGTCYQAKILGSRFENNFTPETSTGYGIQDNGSEQTLVSNCSFFRNRRGFDASGNFPCRNALISDNTVVCTDIGSGLGTHGGADMVTFAGNHVSGGTIGIQVRGGRINVVNNVFANNSIACIIVDFSNNLLISGNKHHGINKTNTQGTGWFVSIFNVTPTKLAPITIVNNEASSLRIAFIRIIKSLEGLVIRNNNVSLRSNANIPLHFIGENDETAKLLQFSVIENNKVLDAMPGVRILSDSISINPNCVTDFFRDPLLEKWGGSGTLASYTINSFFGKIRINGRVSIFIDVSFEITGNTVALFFRNFPHSNFALGDLSNFHPARSADAWLYPTTNRDCYFTPSSSAYQTQWAVGVYRKVFKIDYPIRPVNSYNQ